MIRAIAIILSTLVWVAFGYTVAHFFGFWVAVGIAALLYAGLIAYGIRAGRAQRRKLLEESPAAYLYLLEQEYLRGKK